MNILFYYPDNERSISLSSLMNAFSKQGHSVSLLTHAREGDLHTDVRRGNVSTFSYFIPKESSIVFYIKHTFFLVTFVRKHKIDIVYSHVQIANFISSVAQYFSSAKYILCRHHTDCSFVDYNFNEKTMDKIINVLGKEFIAASIKVKDQMERIEHVQNKKIHVIRYLYDFDQYLKPVSEIVKKIKETYNCRLLLIKVARLIPEKRHILLFNVIKQLVERNFDIKLLVLSDGRERNVLQAFIDENKLNAHIFLLGYRKDIINFIAASDIVVHVSASEASSSLIKEAALVEKPVIVCRNVGDFDEYIIHNENGILLSKEDTESELYVILEKIYNNEIQISSYGPKLRKIVLDYFGVPNIIKAYDVFHNSGNVNSA